MRLTRTGRRNRPYYRIVVMDSRKRRDGRYIEKIGTYDPIKENDNIVLSEERVQYWLGEGVQLSDTVRSILSKNGILLKNHLEKTNLDDELKDQEVKKWEAVKKEKLKNASKTVEVKEKVEEKKVEEAGSVEQKETEDVKPVEETVEEAVEEKEVVSEKTEDNKS